MQWIINTTRGFCKNIGLISSFFVISTDEDPSLQIESFP